MAKSCSRDPCTHRCHNGWRGLLSWLLLVSGLAGGLQAPVALAQSSLEVIQLEHRSAEQVLPMLQPLVEPGGALTGSDYQLFVRASAANVRQLRQAVVEIDREQRQLWVSVRRATRAILEREAAAAAVVLGTRHSSASVQAGNATTRRNGADLAGVQIQEGGTAYICAGESVPVISSVMVGGGRRPWLAAGMEYRDLDNGFMVTPRLNGQRVILDIVQRAERRADSSAQVDLQSLATQVTGQLGEWLSLGAVSESAARHDAGPAGRRYSTQDATLEIWVKVDELVR